MAQTATFGIILESTILAINQTVICDFIEEPIRESAFKEMRRSKPVAAQGKVRRPEPKISMILSDAYCDVIVDIGTTIRNAFVIMGNVAVTVMFTGRVIHQKIIHREIPTACAPEVVSAFESSKTVKAKMVGPIKM
jgi:hypothetical protein